MGQHGANLGPIGPRWAPCWPHEPCCLGRLWSHHLCVMLSPLFAGVGWGGGGWGVGEGGVGGVGWGGGGRRSQIIWWQYISDDEIDGLLQDYSLSIADTLEKPQSCIKPSTCNTNTKGNITAETLFWGHIFQSVFWISTKPKSDCRACFELVCSLFDSTLTYINFSELGNTSFYLGGT